MKKITKQFLGCLGLLIVGSMTFIAYNLPEPVIAAETTDSVTDTITVTVEEPGKVYFDNIKDGETRIDEITFTVISSYNKASKVLYYLEYCVESCDNPANWSEKVLVHTEIPSVLDEHGEGSGTAKFDIAFEKPGTYRISAELYNRNLVPVSGAESIFYFQIPVPNTGHYTTESNIFSNLNIAKTDFLITGLIIFFGFAGFSTYLILRKRK